jgi:hypothetical protein
MQATEHKIGSKTHKIKNVNKKDNNNFNGLKRKFTMLCFYNEDGMRPM